MEMVPPILLTLPKEKYSATDFYGTMKKYVPKEEVKSIFRKLRNSKL